MSAALDGIGLARFPFARDLDRFDFAALAVDVGHGGEHALEPHGPFAAEKAECDQPSCDWPRTDGDSDKPPDADDPVRY